MHIAQCTMHNAHCTMQIAHCTRHNANCTLHNAQCPMHNAQCTLHTVKQTNTFLLDSIAVSPFVNLRRVGLSHSYNMYLDHRHCHLHRHISGECFSVICCQEFLENAQQGKPTYPSVTLAQFDLLTFHHHQYNQHIHRLIIYRILERSTSAH